MRIVSSAHVLFAQGQWRNLRELAADTKRLLSEHPDTAFCYAESTAIAFAGVASAMEGKDQEARASLSRAEAPLQAEPLERESGFYDKDASRPAHARLGALCSIFCGHCQSYPRPAALFRKWSHRAMP